MVRVSPCHGERCGFETRHSRILKFVQSQPLSDLQSCMDVNMETYQATVKNPISRDAVGLSINELLVVEYYSRKV